MDRRFFLRSAVAAGVTSIGAGALATGRWDLKPVQRRAVPMVLVPIAGFGAEALPTIPTKRTEPATSPAYASNPAPAPAASIGTIDVVTFASASIAVYAVLDRTLLRTRTSK